MPINTSFSQIATRATQSFKNVGPAFITSATASTASTTDTLTTPLLSNLMVGDSIIVAVLAPQSSTNNPTITMSSSGSVTWTSLKGPIYNGATYAGALGYNVYQVWIGNVTANGSMTVTSTLSAIPADQGYSMQALVFRGLSGAKRNTETSSVSISAPHGTNLTSPSANSDDLIIKFLFLAVGTITGTLTSATNTVRGNWTNPLIVASFPSSSSRNKYIASQYKIVTGSGTQSANLLFTPIIGNARPWEEVVFALSHA